MAKPEIVQLVKQHYKEMLGFDFDNISEEFINVTLDNIQLFLEKHHDYGPHNIAAFGETGVLIRMNDKYSRLLNLIPKGTAAKFESLEDTWRDMSIYSTIGLMCRTEKWIPTVHNLIKEAIDYAAKEHGKEIQELRNEIEKLKKDRDALRND